MKWDEMTNEELITEWQQTKSQELFEYFVNKNQGILVKERLALLRKLPKLTEEIIYNTQLISLWNCLQTFDASIGTKFTTWYISYFSHHTVRDLLQEYFTIRIPVHAIDGRYNSESVQQGISFASNISYLDTLADDAPTSEDIAEQAIMEQYYLKLLDNLSPRERTIIIKRYGFDGNGCKTLDELGKEFNVTRERIRQIEAKALIKLRKLMKEKYND